MQCYVGNNIELFLHFLLTFLNFLSPGTLTQRPSWRQRWRKSESCTARRLRQTRWVAALHSQRWAFQQRLGCIACLGDGLHTGWSLFIFLPNLHCGETEIPPLSRLLYCSDVTALQVFTPPTPTSDSKADTPGSIVKRQLRSRSGEILDLLKFPFYNFRKPLKRWALEESKERSYGALLPLTRVWNLWLKYFPCLDVTPNSYPLSICIVYCG